MIVTNITCISASLLFILFILSLISITQIFKIQECKFISTFKAFAYLAPIELFCLKNQSRGETLGVNFSVSEEINILIILSCYT